MGTNFLSNANNFHCPAIQYGCRAKPLLLQLYHLLFRSPITDHAWKGKGSLYRLLGLRIDCPAKRKIHELTKSVCNVLTD